MPLIQELDSKDAEAMAEQRRAREEQKALEEKAFDWETAQRAELKGAFI